MSLWLAIAVQALGGPEVDAFDVARSSEPSPLLTLSRCSSGGADPENVVVCGLGRDRYRLPLPTERDPLSGPTRGEAQTGMAALTPIGRCGIFAGERRCGKREAADYGYGNGRDPVTLLSRLAKKAADPDAD